MAGVSQTTRTWSAKTREEGDRLAVEAVFLLRGAVAEFQPGSHLQRAARLALSSSDTAKPPRAAFARHFGQFGAAQAPARREQRQGFEQIGLAGAVVAGERHHVGGDAQVERGIGAEIRQRDPPHHGCAGNGELAAGIMRRF